MKDCNTYTQSKPQGDLNLYESHYQNGQAITRKFSHNQKSNR